MPYPQNWTVYSSGTFSAGLMAISGGVIRTVEGGLATSFIMSPLQNGASLLLYASNAVGNLVRLGDTAMSVGTLQTRLRVVRVVAPTVAVMETGCFFLQTAAALFSNPVSCYGFTWTPVSGAFAVKKYSQQIGGDTATILAANSSFTVAINTEMVLRVSWAASTGGTQIVAYAQAGSSLTFASSLFSLLDTTSPLTPASAVTQGLGLHENSGGSLVLFDSTTLSNK